MSAMHGFVITWFYDDYTDIYGYSQRDIVYVAEKNGGAIEVKGNKGHLEELLAECDKIEAQISDNSWKWTAYLWLISAIWNAHMLQPRRDLSLFYWGI